MTKTTNYQLCQWESTDRILMEDFNGDNAKIDAALKANADAAAGKADAEDLAALEAKVGLRHIKTVSVPSGGIYEQVAISGVDWSQWRTVYLLLTLPMQVGERMDLRVNGSSSNSIAEVTGDTRCLLLLYPMYDEEMPLSGLIIGQGNQAFGFQSVPYSAFSSLELRVMKEGDTIPAGTKLAFYGER